MTTTKTFVTAGTLATALLFGGIVLYMNLSSIAKNVTEKIASETLGVPVHISSMNVELPQKSVTVSGVRISNPSGFKSAYAAQIGGIKIALGDLAQGKPITFNTIEVSGLKMNVEVTPAGVNLEKIRKHAQAHKKPADPEAEPKKIIIKNLKIDPITLTPIVELNGKEIEDITMPPLQLRGIGEKQNGILAGEAITQIWNHVSTKAVQAATKQGFIDNLKGELDKHVDGLKGLLGN